MTSTLEVVLQRVADAFDPPAGLWSPYPKQQLASDLAQQADEVLFGGAAGPGKTEWLLEEGIGQMEAHAGNYGVICRRVFPSLNRTVIPRLKDKLVPTARAKWNENRHDFVFPNGSRLECASLQYKDDVIDFQGAEIGWLGFEEVTEFLESQWEYMVQRLRAPADGIRPYACATTNPGGPGHAWVKRRWVRPDPRRGDLAPEQPPPQPCEIWRPAPQEGVHDEENPPLRRVFVPATHQDNPKLLERDPGYLSRIRALSDRGLRLAMEKGDWDAIDAVRGALWSAATLDEGRIAPEWFSRHIRSYKRVLAVDPADGIEEGSKAKRERSDEYGISCCSLGADGVGYVHGSWGWVLPVRRMAEQTVALYHEMGCGALVVERNHGGRWMMEVFRQVDPNVNLVDVWASDGKRTRAEPVAALFDRNTHDAALPEMGRYRARLVGFHPELEEELTTTTFEPGTLSPNRLDALVWAISWLMLGGRQARQDEYRDDRLRGRR